MAREHRPEFQLEGHVFFWMTQVMASRDRRLAGTLRPFGLRVPEYRALAALYARQRLSMSELSDLASIDRTTLSRTVERMQKSGWLTRLGDAEDMRVVRLALTGAGQRLFARLWPAVDELNRVALSALPAGAGAALRRTLSQMQTNLDEEPADEERAA